MDLDKILVMSIFGFLSVVMVATGGCEYHRDELIGKSADPLAMSCALNSESKACIVIGGRHE